MRRRLEPDREGMTKRLRIHDKAGTLTVYATISKHPDGSLGELFLRADTKATPAVRGLLSVLASTVSIALQHGVPAETILDKFRGTNFEPRGFTQDEDHPMVGSILDYLARWLLALVEEEAAT